MLFQIMEHSKMVLLDVCYRAITEMPLESARDVFLPGTDSYNMYFLLAGHVEYTGEEQVHKFHHHRDERQVTFCEPSLWIRYHHVGRLSCITQVEMLALSSHAFRKVLRRSASPLLNGACCGYAKNLFDEVAEMDVPLDIPEQFDSSQERAQRAFDELPAPLHSQGIADGESDAAAKRQTFQDMELCRREEMLSDELLCKERQGSKRSNDS
jgi:hypothetical protein